MHKKIIYIVGEGRSGSTLLDHILNRNKNTISIGEGFRFWERYSKGESICGCGSPINKCDFWNRVNKQLGIEWYSDQTKIALKNLSKFSAVDEVNSKDNIQLRNLINNFYTAIAKVSDKKIIIDSSKSFGWGKMLSTIDDFEVIFIHIHKDLASLANSWKKEMLLPEFLNMTVKMPIKSIWTIIKERIKSRLLLKKLGKKNLISIQYHTLCIRIDEVTNVISDHVGFEIPLGSINGLQHAIAGNPARYKNELNTLKPFDNQLESLTRFEEMLLRFLNKFLKF